MSKQYRASIVPAVLRTHHLKALLSSENTLEFVAFLEKEAAKEVSPDHFAFGALVDEMIDAKIKGEEWSSENFIIVEKPEPEKSWSGKNKAHFEEVAASAPPGVYLIKAGTKEGEAESAMISQARACADALWSNTDLQSLIQVGAKVKTQDRRIETIYCKSGSVKVRSTPDLVVYDEFDNVLSVIDVKTTKQGVGVYDFTKAAKKFRYDMQAAVFGLIFRPPALYFAVAEADFPHTNRIFQCAQDFTDNALQDVEKALEKWISMQDELQEWIEVGPSALSSQVEKKLLTNHYEYFKND